MVDEICENASNELSDTFEHDVSRYEELLQKFSKVLHPNHYISKTFSFDIPSPDFDLQS